MIPKLLKKTVENRRRLDWTGFVCGRLQQGKAETRNRAQLLGPGD
ncbi:MAG: hypothetical protein O9327_08685 [Polaromonas sp.]|nr:hypothetical protein [Polaromonas sp.]